MGELQNIAVTQFDNKNTWSDEAIDKRLYDTYGVGVPTWSPYTLDKGATMIFDAQSGEMYHHDKELMRILVPTYSY